MGMNKQDKKVNEFGLFILSGLAIVVGIVAGFGAVVFRWMIALFHNLFFFGTFSITYDATVHTNPSPWGAAIILVPVVGSFLVTYMVKNFAPEAKGHGVPEIMEAIYYKKGNVRPIVALIKSLASAISIGSGGSVGREGPIIQIGSSFGSTVGRLIKIQTWQRITLIAAGAGGGIAATFNTPIGGILFAIEIMMQEVSVRTLVPVSLATVTSAYIGRTILGSSPAFHIPGISTRYFGITSPESLIMFLILGILMGLVSAIYIKAVYKSEDFFNKTLHLNDYTRHAVGMLVVGLMMYILMATTGRYYIQGVGYATIQDILSSHIQIIWLLLLLAALKLIGVSLTLGSGASGGVFSPGLYMGATVGGAFGIFCQHLFPDMNIFPVAFAVAGMAGVISGSTGAAMAAIVMIFEMTLDYNVVIPMTLTVAVSYGIRKMIIHDSIYTMKLARRGRHLPDALHTNYPHEVEAGDIMDSTFQKVANTMKLKDIFKLLDNKKDLFWLLRCDKEGRVNGIITKDEILTHRSQNELLLTMSELNFEKFETVDVDTNLYHITNILSRSGSRLVLVLIEGHDTHIDNVAGVITRKHIFNTIEQSLELFSG
jgi:chloride channel protein, CIC family